MEEAWNQGLSRFREYPILRRETLRALFAFLFGESRSEAPSVSDWLEERLQKFSIEKTIDRESLECRLLDSAAEEIFRKGIAHLNRKRIAERVGVAPSKGQAVITEALGGDRKDVTKNLIDVVTDLIPARL